MNNLKGVALIVIAGLLAGCAGSARQDYYVAMQIAASEKAKVQSARYDALSKMAASGDPGTSAAAVMAIALTEDNSVTPQYVESESLSWARVLANPLATLGLAGIQANVAMNASNNAADVQLASFEANKAIQLGQQSMVTDLGGQWSSAAAAGGTAVAELGVAGFNALNTAGQQNVDIATTGFDTVDNVATTGFGAAQVLGVTGMTSVESMGTVAVDGMNTMSADYNNTINGIINTNAATLQGVSTDYVSAIADINNTVNAILADTQ